MNDWNGVTNCRFPGILLATLLLLAPVFASADPLYLLRTTKEEPVPYTSLKNAQARSVAVTLNENGDMLIRYRRFDVTLAYNPPEDTLKHTEKTWIAMRQECPVIGGISMKVSYSF